MKRHIACSIDGLLAKTDPELEGWFRREDGSYATPAEARAMLKEQLALGRKLLPYGEMCEGFSYETGCPGHRTENVEEAKGETS